MLRWSAADGRSSSDRDCSKRLNQALVGKGGEGGGGSTRGIQWNKAARVRMPTMHYPVDTRVIICPALAESGGMGCVMLWAVVVGGRGSDLGWKSGKRGSVVAHSGSTGCSGGTGAYCYQWIAVLP
ncbi:unnamed protein product [Tuber melanosporum]|uniref:(Perigord truffle) hypothetical protein n=1 Tax=Tuber melanosporum (strain Mel28) TaxID=656061 RepID=D5GHD6_TUBMM|nr:uncharacterized protein GSTUM_00007814001 [Tuber melanosporum]CAZ83929.1 unnamed protein product [Tuber melanosporum]